MSFVRTVIWNIGTVNSPPPNNQDCFKGISYVVSVCSVLLYPLIFFCVKFKFPNKYCFLSKILNSRIPDGY